MRVAASTNVGESSLSEANDIFVRTPEDGKHATCRFDKRSKWWCVFTAIDLMLPLVSEAISMR